MAGTVGSIPQNVPFSIGETNYIIRTIRDHRIVNDKLMVVAFDITNRKNPKEVLLPIMQETNPWFK